MLTRRSVIQGLAAAGLLAAPLAGLAGVGFPSVAFAQQANLADLAVAGPLGDVEMGSKDAKATVIEYASMTCSHCAAFHARTWPDFKKKYVDTGKVRFILREFPLDPLATAGFMLARCGGNDKFYPIVDLLFDQQKNWAYTDKPVAALAGLMKQAGFTQESFEACLKNQQIYDAVNFVKERAAQKFSVDSTPTFFINGQKQNGAISLEEFDKILTPIVGG
jgi:protein-disulfide isomerase